MCYMEMNTDGQPLRWTKIKMTKRDGRIDLSTFNDNITEGCNSDEIMRNLRELL